MNLIAFYESIDLDMIESWVRYGQEEHLQLEFKLLNVNSMSRDDRKNFAKCLSGFANSSGGIVVWGVKATKDDDGVDRAIGLEPIRNVTLFVSKLNEYTGQFVSPLVDGVRHKCVLSNMEDGFVVTLIPESSVGPHMAKGGEQRYYKRSGDSFYAMEHFDIADMFGRRKRPELSLVIQMYQKNSGTHHFRWYEVLIMLGIQNQGIGSARSPYLSLNILSEHNLAPYGISHERREGLPRLPHGGEDNKIVFGGDANVVIHPSVTYPVTAFLVRVIEGFPVDTIRVNYEIASENFLCRSGNLIVSGDAIQDFVFEEFKVSW